MECPYCFHELIIVGQARLQTLEEHVSNPNGKVSLKDKYSCSNNICETHKYGVYWNEYGEKYSQKYENKLRYIDNNDAPFGSLERKLNVEISKKDENIHWRFGKYHLELDWKYKSNFNGDILSKKPTFKLWINNTLYISGIRMLIFMIKSHYQNPKFRIGEDYNKDFEYPKYHNMKQDWWRWAAPWVLRIIDYKNYSKLQK